jgi:hypothetical protein
MSAAAYTLNGPTESRIRIALCKMSPGRGVPLEMKPPDLGTAGSMGVPIQTPLSAMQGGTCDSVLPPEREEEEGKAVTQVPAGRQGPAYPANGTWSVCRLADTRGGAFTGPFGPPALVAPTPRVFPVAG